MKKSIFLILMYNSLIIYSQVEPIWAANQPNLGLNGIVTWIDSNHIRVEYDWSDDSQLKDWVLTDGSTFLRGNGFVTITGGNNSSVWAMIWRQGIKCSRINAKDAAPLSSAGHLNFYSNITSFNGFFLPNPGLGVVLYTRSNFWTYDGAQDGTIGAPLLVVGVTRDYEYNVSATGMTIKSSVNNKEYSYNKTCVPAFDRKIALGGWSGITKWGKITIEGEVTIPWQHIPIPSDVINIQSYGSVFAPVIEVVGTPLIEWVFDDSTTNASSTPLKDYGSAGTRHNYLKVTPWSSLIGINVGYDSSDGGYGGFAMVENQNVLGFQNLVLAKSSLEYLCASYNLMTELDLRGLVALKFLEFFHCSNLVTLKLSSHPVLERLCVEDCSLDSLDLSGCTALGDLRAAANNYTSINWGSIGQSIWHICIRDNPLIKGNIPLLTQFPVLRELLNWKTNQTGTFVCHSSEIQLILSDMNHFTNADINGCTNLSMFNLSGNQLTSLDLGTADYLTNLQLKDCSLAKSIVDYILLTLDQVGQPNGTLVLTGNEAPSSAGIVHRDNLNTKGWTISITEPGQPIPVTDITITTAGGVNTISSDKGTLQLNAEIIPTVSTDNTVLWSITSGANLAKVDSTGLVTALHNGIITVMGTVHNNSEIYDEMVIIISNQTNSDDVNFPSMGKIIVTIDELKILLNEDYTSWKASLYNFQGNLVSSQFVKNDLLIFNISKLAPGIYIVVLSKGDNIRVAEFIKP